MAHSYPTRFQAKKIQQAKAVEPQQVKQVNDAQPKVEQPKVAQSKAEQPRRAQSYDEAQLDYLYKLMSPTHKEYIIIKNILDQLKDETTKKDRIKKASIGLQLFHYLEYHHLLMKENASFRKDILDKSNKFIRDAEEEERKLKDNTLEYEMRHRDEVISTEELLKQCRITMLAQQLRESSQRLQNIIGALHTI